VSPTGWVRSHRQYPSIAITVVAIGSWYPRGVARLINAFAEVSDGFEIVCWVNCYPPGAPGKVVRGDQEYGGYAAKPFALKALKDRQVDIGILLDASFWPIRHIQPLVDTIAKDGYFMAPDGFVVGQWMSDAGIRHFGIDREEAMGWPGCLSGCVGLDFRRENSRLLVDEWAASWPTFPGHHSNDRAAGNAFSYRNVGPVSTDPRVLGHRQDQSALAVIARKYGMTDYTRPRLFSYGLAAANDDTVLVCEGIS
jgi:hypothetical protein